MTPGPLNPAIWFGERLLHPPPGGIIRSTALAGRQKRHEEGVTGVPRNPRFRPMETSTHPPLPSPALKASATYLARASDCVPYRNGATTFATTPSSPPFLLFPSTKRSMSKVNGNGAEEGTKLSRRSTHLDPISDDYAPEASTGHTFASISILVIDFLGEDLRKKFEEYTVTNLFEIGTRSRLYSYRSDCIYCYCYLGRLLVIFSNRAGSLEIFVFIGI